MTAETTKTRRWWAPIGLGTLICVGCCLAPLLTAAGLASGGIALLSLSWLEPLGFALIIGGVAGWFWARARSRRSGCGSDSGCGGTAAEGSESEGCGCTTAAAR
ncbi:hypothetical protein ACQP0C_30965 [Nocardia sp. CA-129566]|uniref:hypothetical protein n=1 Tax=Nocardia sp. CA-129566 TaxID=3239976 RepID=UPI003D97D964